MAQNKISVELAYAGFNAQKVYTLTVLAGSTIQDVITVSNVCLDFPEIDLTQCKVGVFSQRKSLGDAVFDGDRIEIYRPLIIDPKEARRAKAKQKHKQA